MNILDIEKYEDTFGPKSKRKRPKLLEANLDALANIIEEKTEKYDPAKD